MRKYLFILMVVFIHGLTISSPAQTTSTQATTPDRVLGDVVEVKADGREFTLDAAGKKVLVKTGETTVFRRVPAGEKTLEKAVEIKFEEMGVGDRVLARGTADDKKEVLSARVVIVMSKAEITQKRERDRADWLRRGIVGVVSATNPETKEITLLMRAPEGDQSIAVTTDSARFRRYAPDSVNFSDARASAFAELKVGDQLRALGEKSSDGTRYKAEEIVSGTFRTIIGTVVSNTANGAELTVKDVRTNQSLTVTATKDSVIRRFTQELVKLLEQHATKTAPRSGGDLHSMIESLPPLTVADLKPGDAVLITSTAGADASRITAALIASGVEDLLKRQQTATAPREFNLGLGLPSGALP